MSIVAPEQPSTAQQPAPSPMPAPSPIPAQSPIAARPRIIATRKLLTKRFGSLGFTVAGGGSPFWEVLLFTDRSLIDPRNANQRTPSTFYSSRQDGGLRKSAATGDDVFLVPSAVLRGFASAMPKPTAIYFTIAAYADGSGTSPVFPAPPELLALNAPSVQVSPDFTPDAVDAVLGVHSSRLTVVAQSLDTTTSDPAATAPVATPAPAPAAAPPVQPAVPTQTQAPAPATSPAMPVDPGADAAAGEDGYSYYANHPDLFSGTDAQPVGQAPAAASPATEPAATQPHAASAHDGQPYDDGYGAYDDGWSQEEGWAGAQSASFPAGFGEPAALVDRDAPAVELGGVERVPYRGLDEPDGTAAPGPASAPAPVAPAPVAAPPPPVAAAPPQPPPVAIPAGRSLALTIDDKRALIQHLAGDAGTDRYGAVNADGEYKGRFGPDHPAYHHHHVGLSFGVVQFTQESGSLGRLLALMKQRDEALFARTFGEHADELIAVTNAVGPPSTESPDGRSARLQPVGGADLWDEPWLARFRAAGAETAFQSAQNELAATLFIDPVLGFAGDLGLDTDRALAVVVDRAAQLGCDPAKQWIVAAVGPIQTEALRQQALSALGFSDLASFQQARGLPSDNLFGPDTHAALTGALRALGTGTPIQLPTVEQMLDGLVRRADADNTYWAASVKRLRTDTGFADKPYPRT